MRKRLWRNDVVIPATCCEYIISLIHVRVCHCENTYGEIAGSGKSTNSQRVKTRLYQLVSAGRGSLNDLLYRPQHSLYRHQSRHSCRPREDLSLPLLVAVSCWCFRLSAWLRGRRILYTLRAQKSKQLRHSTVTDNKVSARAIHPKQVVKSCAALPGLVCFFWFVRFCIATGYHYCVCNLESAVTSSRLKTRCDAHSFCLHTSHKQLRV